MTNFNPNYPGSVNGADTTPAEQRAMYLTLFAEEVFQVYFSKTMMKDKVRVKQIAGGKEFTFPLVGRTTAAYHTAGEALTGGTILHNEQKIAVDAKLIADIFVDKLEEKLNMYEVRSYYAKACGEALAYAFDKNCFRQIGLSARAAHPITGEPGGTTLYGVDDSTGESLYQAIKLASQTLVEKDRDPKYVPTYCVLPPDQYYKLLDYLPLLNRDYAGSGSLLTADVPMVANIGIMHSNLFEAGIDVVAAAEGNYLGKYSIDFTDTIGLIWSEDAIGCVQAMDMATEAEYDMRYQGWLLACSQAHGWGNLVPTNAVELSTATAP